MSDALPRQESAQQNPPVSQRGPAPAAPTGPEPPASAPPQPIDQTAVFEQFTTAMAPGRLGRPRTPSQW